MSNAEEKELQDSLAQWGIEVRMDGGFQARTARSKGLFLSSSLLHAGLSDRKLRYNMVDGACRKRYIEGVLWKNMLVQRLFAKGFSKRFLEHWGKSVTCFCLPFFQGTFDSSFNDFFQLCDG